MPILAVGEMKNNPNILKEEWDTEKERKAKEDALMESVEELKKMSDFLEALIVSLGGEVVDDRPIHDIEVKFNQSVARAVRRNGQLTRIHPVRMKINNKEIDINNSLLDHINQMLLEI